MLALFARCVADVLCGQMKPTWRFGHKAVLWAIMAGIPNAMIAKGFNAKGARMHFKVIGVLCVGALCAIRVKEDMSA